MRRARTLVGILIVLSLSAILYHFVFDTGRQVAEIRTTGTVSSLTAPVTPVPSTSSTIPSPPPREIERFTPVPISDPGATGPALKRWPAAGSVEILRTVDLTTYATRAINSDKALDGITVVLDPGHGGIDSGCGWPVGVRDQAVMEKDVTLQVALHAKASLEDLGARVLLLREEDLFQSIFYRPAQVAEWVVDDFMGAADDAGIGTDQLSGVLDTMTPILEANQDTFAGAMGGTGTGIDLKQIMDIQRQYPDWLYVSIHCNAAVQYPDAQGLQVFYTTSGTVWHEERMAAPNRPTSEWNPSYQHYDDGGRYRLAGLMYDKIIGRVPGLERGQGDALVDQDFAVLREQNLTSVMLELGFLTNQSDREILMDPATPSRVGEALAEAVFTYYAYFGDE